MLNKIINECLEKYEGGERFFEAIDYEIRNNTKLFDSLINLVDKVDYDYVIVSGHFGSVFKTYCKNTEKLDYNKIIKVRGSLRYVNDVENYHEYYDIKDKKMVFLDDTYYSGKTKRKIVNSIIDNDGDYKGTYVIYDGSKVKQNDVSGLYRYYDHYS